VDAQALVPVLADLAERVEGAVEPVGVDPQAGVDGHGPDSLSRSATPLVQ